jgi:hypothetical protein
MVRAWQFGSEWEIPAFQNEVMRCLVAKFEHNYVNLRAMRQAYQASTTGKVARDKLLQKAFITEFAHENRDEHKYWREEEFSESGLDDCSAFHRDYTRIMCLASGDDESDPRTDRARIEELLVSETTE